MNDILKNKKKLYKKEFLFNFFSLITIICIGIYFGFRSFYYYSKQNSAINSSEYTLGDKIFANNKVTNEDVGFRRDKSGYYFKGKVENNYVKFANRYFRIIRLNKDNTVKLISDDSAAVFIWGNNTSFKKSNLFNWLNKTKNPNSGIYYDTIPSIDKFLVKTEYSEDNLMKSEVKKSNTKYHDYISTLTINDYLNAAGKNSYLNNGKYSWVIGHNKDKSNLYISEDGSIDSTGSYEAYGIRPVITLKKDVKIIDGDGTKDNPYVINQGKNTNMVDQYIKLGNDTWKVYQDKDGILKLSLFKYIGSDNNFIAKPFSNLEAIFNISSNFNIGYYLNTELVPNLPYSNLMLNTTYNTGEIGDDSSLDYYNIYNNKVECKMGLLNMFDYNPNNSLTDYYLVNTMSNSGEIVYVYNNLGVLDDANVTEQKYVVPTISILKKNIKSGNGTIENPYVVE